MWQFAAPRPAHRGNSCRSRTWRVEPYLLSDDGVQNGPVEAHVDHVLHLVGIIPFTVGETVGGLQFATVPVICYSGPCHRQNCTVTEIEIPP
jgi:hypothetical protein